MKNYVINLKRREDRLRSFEKRWPLREPALIFEACDGHSNEMTQPMKRMARQVLQQSNHDKKFNVGEFGCLVSHLTLWLQLVESDDDVFFIFEDDAEFDANFSEMYTACKEFLQTREKPTFVQMGQSPNPFGQKIRSQTSDTLVQDLGPQALHAQGLNRAMAQQLVTSQNTYDIGIDVWLRDFLSKHTEQSYCCNPMVSYAPRSLFNSDILSLRAWLSLKRKADIEKQFQL